jgi:hypothetical protein
VLWVHAALLLLLLLLQILVGLAGLQDQEVLSPTRRLVTAPAACCTSSNRPYFPLPTFALWYCTT